MAEKKTKKESKKEIETKEEAKKTEKKVKLAHGKKYLTKKQLVDRNKKYLPLEAFTLVKQVSLSKFEGSVEAHFVTIKTGLKGELIFPHSLGKQVKARIADEALLKELDNNKIDFDILVATPAFMPKLLKFAKLLGPKGLMPNPKNGTIGNDPEKIVKDLAGKTQFKTEAKAPIMHVVFGKVKTSEKELEENFKALVTAVGLKNITKATIAPTMGPGIKIDLEKI
jgi:large subunit ribosomal protein L1